MSAFELHPTNIAEIAAIGAVVARAEEHDGLPLRTSESELREVYASPGFIPASDGRSAYVHDRLVGTARVTHVPSGFRQETAFLTGEVDPAFRGTGIGRALMAWQIERAREQLAGSASGLPKYIRVTAHDFRGSAHRLYDRFGLGIARHFDEMIVGLGDLAPIGDFADIEIVAWPHDRSEELRLAKNMAFAEHWGSAPVSPESWSSWMGAAHTRLDLSVVALDRRNGAIAGHCVVTHYPQDEWVTGRREGWIDNVGTLPPWRGRGVAASMILTCLHAFRAEGLTHGMLEVDRENETGAPALYRRLGFVTAGVVVARQQRVG